MSFHCCEKMDFFLAEQKVDIYYSSNLRKYSIGLIGCEYSAQTIFFCPWCGFKFPKPLDDEFWDIMDNELKVDTNVFDFIDDPKVPDEFKTDEWWKKRGL